MPPNPQPLPKQLPEAKSERGKTKRQSLVAGAVRPGNRQRPGGRGGSDRGSTPGDPRNTGRPKRPWTCDKQWLFNEYGIEQPAPKKPAKVKPAEVPSH